MWRCEQRNIGFTRANANKPYVSSHSCKKGRETSVRESLVWQFVAVLQRHVFFCMTKKVIFKFHES